MALADYDEYASHDRGLYRKIICLVRTRVEM